MIELPPPLPRRQPRQRDPLFAAVLVGIVAGGYLGLWWALVENASCAEGEEWCGFGEGLVMLLGGGPVAILLAGLALRAAGARLWWAGMGALFLATLVLPRATAALMPNSDLPVFVWPFLLAAAGAGWVLAERSLLPEAD